MSLGNLRSRLRNAQRVARETRSSAAEFLQYIRRTLQGDLSITIHHPSIILSLKRPLASLSNRDKECKGQ